MLDGPPSGQRVQEYWSFSQVVEERECPRFCVYKLIPVPGG